jgi:hypothetical protein
MCPRERQDCHEITAEHDDLREAQCENRNNASLLEVLKFEVECGWGSEAPTIAPSWVLRVIVIIYAFLPANQ